MTVAIKDAKGVGETLHKRFLMAGIRTTYDLLITPPKSYERYEIVDVSALSDGEKLTLRAVVLTPPESIRTTRISRVAFDVLSAGLTLIVLVFNRDYLKELLHPGDHIIIKGHYRAANSTIIATTIQVADTVSPIQPVYGFEGIHDKIVAKIIRSVYEQRQVEIYETLPKEDLATYRLPSREQALMMLHFPSCEHDLTEARRRFKYEEAFFLNLAMARQNPRIFRPPKAYDLAVVKSAISALAFELTNDQKNATNALFRDFKKPYAQFRLIQGDVGSGKTIVAGLAALAVASAGEQVAIMAPTELLAKQHHEVLSTMFKDMAVALLSSRTKDKKSVKEAIANHAIDVVIGTHALIEKDVVFHKLGLVIIDEQHRFGVRARSELGDKAMAQDVIYLTATPIPRTLAMVVFKDANISVIKEKPQARPEIMTHYVTSAMLDHVFTDMEERLRQGDNVFIVVPAIDSLEKGENIQTVSALVNQRLHADVLTLHSRMPAEDRDLAMATFRERHGVIMIATTMIEVGIDVAHATMMLVFSAEQFGLSQLHQLRGRVGRGERQSVCYLVSGNDDSERLRILEQTNDGFALSAKDLEFRGPGQFLGERQSGYFKFRFLDFSQDTAILEEASKRVGRLLMDPLFEGSSRQKHLWKRLEKMVGSADPYAI